MLTEYLVHSNCFGTFYSLFFPPSYIFVVDLPIMTQAPMDVAGEGGFYAFESSNEAGTVNAYQGLLVI